MSSVDADLPEELRKLFNALHCTLCDAKMNSPISARMHYESKQHDKKVNQWLADWSQRTGEPLPKRQKLVSAAIDLYCNQTTPHIEIIYSTDSQFTKWRRTERA